MHHFGPPEVLTLDDVQGLPEPRGDQVLVSVRASSVNGTDLGLRRGDIKIATWGRMPFTVGFDIAGTVKAIGPAVTAFAPGDPVMALLGHGGGGQAEEVLVSQSKLASTPRTATWTQAAAIPLAGLTALQAFFGRAHLQHRSNGTRVLVIGATGGIGSFAVQLAALSGAHISAVGSAHKLPSIADLGVDESIPRESFDPKSGKKWDVVFDAHGGVPAEQARNLLRSGGTLVTTRPISCAAITERIVPQRLQRNRFRYASVMTSARSQDLARLASLVDQGRLRPLVDSVFTSAMAADAHRRAEGDSTGKVVIAMSKDT